MWYLSGSREIQPFDFYNALKNDPVVFLWNLHRPLKRPHAASLVLCLDQVINNISRPLFIGTVNTNNISNGCPLISVYNKAVDPDHIMLNGLSFNLQSKLRQNLQN